jgi:Zn-dependent protease with chaperone function
MSAMLASGCLFVVSATDAYGGAPNERPNGSVVLLLLAFTVFVCLVVVGRYARLLELQADLWAANKMSDAPQYMRAIAAVAVGNPDEITWLHPSFRQRNDFLKQDEKAAVWLRRRLQIATAISVVWTGGFFLAAAALNGS